MRKDLPQKLLRELLKNSKRSDRDLAKVLNVSQPTITRARHRLEKNGLIKDYTIVPDFEKMGFELLAINLVKIRAEHLSPEIFERAREFSAKFPSVVFSSAGEGLGMTGMSMSFYKNYKEYHQRVNQMRATFKDLIQDIQSFIIPLGEGEFKRFSLTHLKDVPL